MKFNVFGKIGAYFCLASIERGLGQEDVVIIGLYNHKVYNLSKTSFYSKWAENNLETGHFQHNYWK